MGVTWDFDDGLSAAFGNSPMTDEQIAAFNKQEWERQCRDGEKIETIERAQEIAIEMGFSEAPYHALEELMNYAADKNAREFGDGYSIDYQMRYATRKDFDRYLAGTCRQYGVERTAEGANAPVLA
jgi:Ni/Co efflux regulator RcnB